MRLFVILFLFVSSVYAQDEITVGIKESPPFVIKENGDYHGIAIGIAEYVLSNYQITYKEYNSVSDLVNAVENNAVDVGVGAISITSSRDKQIDYTHAFKSSGVSALYPSKDNDIITVLKESAPDLLKAVTRLVLFMAIGGLIYWLLERKNEFSFKRAVYGIFNGLYWASATTTTVGYGDVSAQTKSGRVFSVFWMWVSIFAMGTITATIVASVNSNSQSTKFELTENVSGVLEGSRAQELAAINGISTKSYYNLENLFDGLTDGDISAIIHDTPILEYYAKDNNIQNVEMQELDFQEDRYAFIANNGSDIIDSMNSKILSFIESTRWKKLLSQY